MQLRKLALIVLYGAVLAMQTGCATAPSGFTSPPVNQVDDDIKNPLSGKSGG